MSKDKKPTLRQNRVNELIKRSLSDSMIKEGIPNEIKGAFISISEVSISPDFKNANVFFSCINSELDVKSIVKILNANIYRYQASIVKELRLPKFPKLQFKYDNSFAKADKINRVLKDST